MASEQAGGALRRLDDLSRIVARLTSWTVVVLATIMIVALLLQVFFRYALGSALSWSEELALIVFAWVILLASTTAVRDGSLVSLDVLVDKLPGRARTLWSRVISLAVLVFWLALAVTGGTYVRETLGQVTAAMRLPIEWLHLAAPVAGVLGAFHALVRILVPPDAVGLSTGSDAP